MNIRMESIIIRPYKNRSEMTYYELEEHKKDLISKRNKRAYIKRKYYQDTYNEMVEVIESLNNDGSKVDKDFLNALTICEEYLGYAPIYKVG